MRKHYILFFPLMMGAALLASFPVQAQVPSELPHIVDAGGFRPLYNTLDEPFQKRLETFVRRKQTWSRLTNDKRLAIGVVQIGDPRNPKFARVNGRIMMYAASLPKIAVLLAAMHGIENKTLPETTKIFDDMRLMIRRSDNRATTRLIDQIGIAAINQLLRAPPYKLYDEARGGGLWVGKRYAATGPRIPDPVMGLSHGATVTQVCRFYYMLVMGKLINHNRSRQMLEIMSSPQIRHKFVKVMGARVPEAHLFRKSGTWKQWHSDPMLVWGPKWRRYIVVGMVESPEGESILQSLMAAVDDLLKKEAAPLLEK